MVLVSATHTAKWKSDARGSEGTGLRESDRLLSKIAADFVAVPGFQNLAGVEIILKLGEKSIAFDFPVDAGEEEFRAAGQEGGVELGTAYDVEASAVRRFFDGVKGAKQSDSFDVGFPRNDPVFAPRERLPDGVVSFSPHDDDVPERCAFEKFQVLGDVPRNAAIDSDDAVAGHGGDGDHGLDRDRGFDGRMRVVAFQSEILEDKVLETRASGVENHSRQRAALARELQASLLEVVGVEVEVAKGVNKGSRTKTADLSDHERQKSVGSDIEGHTKEEIRAALVELATEFALLHIKLKKRMAGSEGHEVEFGGIPCRHHEAAAVGILFNVIHNSCDLIDRNAIRSAPVAPLRTINPAEVAILIRPLVPDRHIVFPQVADVCLALQEPEKLVDDRA